MPLQATQRPAAQLAGLRPSRAARRKMAKRPHARASASASSVATSLASTEMLEALATSQYAFVWRD